MIDTIFLAAENFCIHQINAPHSTNIEIPKTRTLIAYIDINTYEHKKQRVYLAGEYEFFQKITHR